MTSGTLQRAARPIVWLLAGATTLMLVASGVLLAGQWRDGAAATQAGPLLQRDGVRVPLPVGATLLPRDERLFYAGADGRAVAEVRGPAVLAPEVCPDVPGSSRGFVGIVRSVGSVDDAHARLVATWSSGLGRAVGSRARASPVDVEDGVRTDLTAVVRIDAPCQPKRVRASLLTVPVDGRTGARAVTVVLVRDVGAPGEIGDGVAELMLAGVRVL